MMCKDSTLKAAVNNSFNAYNVLLYEPEVCSKIFAVTLNHYVGQYCACCSCPLSAQLGMWWVTADCWILVNAYTSCCGGLIQTGVFWWKDSMQLNFSVLAERRDVTQVSFSILAEGCNASVLAFPITKHTLSTGIVLCRALWELAICLIVLAEFYASMHSTLAVQHSLIHDVAPA